MSKKQARAETEEPEVEWSADNGEDLSDILGFDLGGVESVDRSGLRALINSALVSHRRMPVLDVIFDRTARMMTTSLRQLTDDNVEVSLDDVTTTRFGDFQQSVIPPAVIGVMRAGALNGYGLIAADPALVFSIVDILLGGRRGGAALSLEERGFTAIELGLAQRILTAVATDLNTAFTPVIDAGFALDRIETTPRFASIAQEASVCAIAKYRIRMEGRGGRVSILLPHALLEPVRKSLAQEFASEQATADDAWRAHLAAETAHAHISLDAVLAETEMTVGALSALQSGDRIIFPRSAGRSVELRAGRTVVARGKAGRSGECVAVQIDAPAVAASEEEGEAA